MIIPRLRDGGALGALAFAAAVMFSSGCDNGLGVFGDSPARPTLNLSTLGIGSASTHFESVDNNAFDSAEFVEVGSAARVIRGRINGSGDVDLYDLGPMSRGTRVIVDMTFDDTLDGALALFDDTGATLLVNDHRNGYLGRKEPYIDVVMRHDSDSCYVAVAATPGYSAFGDYALQASKVFPTPMPSPRSDAVLLQFAGGNNIQIGRRTPINVPAFSAASIDSVYSGQTSEMIARVVANIREDYEGLNLTIYSTSEGTQYDGFMTRLFFGTFDPGLLGVAEGVDEYNGVNAQEGIVFTDTFRAFMQIDPSMEQMSRALANVASHEIGHLLGLVHTSDREGIMDVTASLNQLLVDQTFKMSPLYSVVFPVGYQDSLMLLLESLGGDFELTPFQAITSRATVLKSVDPNSGPPARDLYMLGSCGLKER